MIGLKKNKYLIFNVFFILAPFTVFYGYENLFKVIPTSVISIILTSIYAFLLILYNGGFKLNIFERKIIFLFITPIFTSFIGILSALLIEKNASYYEYITFDFFNRLFLVVCNIIIFTTLLTITKSWDKYRIVNLVKKYYYGLFIFVLFGLWQLLHFIFKIPFLNLKVRAYIHSVSSSHFLFNFRLTSLANEPSYFAPLLIDFILISFIVYSKPKIMPILGLILLAFTYSGGGYIDIIVILFYLIFAYFKYNAYKIKEEYIIILFMILGICGGIITFYFSNIYEIFYPVIGRFSSFFNIYEHIRMFMFLMPFLWVLEGTIFNALFGFGPGSYKFLHKTKMLPGGNPVHVTSNNLFADTVFELGYFGFISYLILFCKLLLKSYRNIYKNKNSFIAFLMTVHLFMSSIYRADFMQPRFWIVLFIIIKLINENGKIDRSSNENFIC